MNKAPRASLSITILDDEDYRILMDTKSGMEAFGTFVVMIIVGRERLQQGQARQMSGSDSLIFDNSLTHVLSMGHVTRKQFDRCLNALNAVAIETGSPPWMHINKDSRLVIRSFFKFNASASWGGPRPGAGRPARQNQDACKGNQDDSIRNHLDSNLKPSWSLSDSDSDSDSIAPPNPPSGGGACGSIEPEDAESLPPELEPRIRNDPAVVKRTATTADRLFPAMDFGAKVYQLQADYDVPVLEMALLDAHAADKANWDYIAGIYRNRMKDGRGAKPSTNGRPADKPVPAHPEHRAAPDSKFHKFSRDAYKAKDGGE